MTTYTARLLPLNLRDTDGVDPKVLLQGIRTSSGEFRDHCYVSISKNKHLEQFLKTAKKPVVIEFKAKPVAYTITKRTLTRIKGIKTIG